MSETVGTNCLNCGATLSGPWCAACGQNSNVHRTLASLWHDIAHGVFHFEGKVWRTLPMLLLRPGELTRRYIAGERTKFVSPLALFLFCVFLLYATLKTVGAPVKIGDKPVADARTRVELATQLKQAKDHVAALQAKRAAALAAHQPVAAIDAQITDATRELRGAEVANLTVSGFRDEQSADDVSKAVNTGYKSLDRRIVEILHEPNLFIHELQASAYKYAWGIIPLSLPFMWLLFINRRRQVMMFDHAVFVTYSVATVLLIFTAMTLLSAMGLSGNLLILLVPVHFFIQLKGAYGLSSFSAAWRTVALALIAFIVVLLFALLVALLGLAG